MLSNKTAILQLASLCAAHGVRDVVLCPGSRNAPLCHTFSQLPQFTCHALTDERSAGFFALGLALATQRIVAVCVTSGSALLNLHPAVAEAYYQEVPLLILSADRPAAWIGQMDGQTLPQPHVFGSLVKYSASLPELDAPNGASHREETEGDAPLLGHEWYCNRLINEALLACTHRTQGPVHLNIPLHEPLYSFTIPDLPKERVIRRVTLPAQGPLVEQWVTDFMQYKGVMVLAGQHAEGSTVHDALQDLLYELHAKHCVVLGESLANSNRTPGVWPLTEDEVETWENLCTEQNREWLQTDLLITLGGHIVNKRLKQILRKHPPRAHWHIDPAGRVVDVMGCLSTVIEASYADLANSLHALDYTREYVQSAACDHRRTYYYLWEEIICPEDPDNIYSIPYTPHQPANRWEEAVQHLMACLPSPAVLHLANSSSVRYAQHYLLPEEVTVCCNRGVNGIEGSLSAAVGYATACPDRPNFVVIGDLSFFYDQNALWNTALPKNLHILLLNSQGGQIFDTLPVPHEARSRQFICAPHGTTAAAVAQQYGLQYLKGITEMGNFVRSTQSVLLEVL